MNRLEAADESRKAAMSQTDKLKTELHALKVCVGFLLISIFLAIGIGYIVLDMVLSVLEFFSNVLSIIYPSIWFKKTTIARQKLPLQNQNDIWK